MSKIKKLFLNPGSSMAYAVITAIFTIVPEEYFKLFCINPKWQVATTVLVNRVMICVGIFVLGNAGNALFRLSMETCLHALQGESLLILMSVSLQMSVMRHIRSNRIQYADSTLRSTQSITCKS